MGRVMAAAASRALTQIRYVTPVPASKARGLVDRVYRQVIADFGMLAPPVAVHAPVPEALAACWLMLRESLVAAGELPRAVKETIASAVSTANSCPYCAQIHGLSLTGFATPADTRAVLAGDLGTIGDVALREIALWAGTTGTGTAPPPLPAHQWPEAIGVAVTFHYLNRIVNVFLPESPVPGGIPATVDRTVKRVAGRILGSYARKIRLPGRSRVLLPPAPLPPDMSWARSGTHIAPAFGSAAAAIEAVGAARVPAAVRAMVVDELAAFGGLPPDLGRDWQRTALSGLAPADRPVGRLALLAARASYRVVDADIDAVRATGADDATVIGVVSWASLAAARRVGAGMDVRAG